jgi:preprotein translocase subunit SecA
MNRMLLGALAGIPAGAAVASGIGAYLLGGFDSPQMMPILVTGAVLGLIGGAIAGDPKKVLGSKNERELKRLRPTLQKITDHEAAIAALSDDDLRAKTAVFRAHVHEATEGERDELERLRGEVAESHRQGPDAVEDLRERIKKQEEALYREENRVLDEILPEAFACVREASRRTIGLRHYDVQMLGGMVLHRGKIAEMKTGEGKTLVATLPVYLNALSGRGVHLVTVNDYLARRDVQWMGPVYHALGLTVATIVHDESFQFDPSYVVKDYRMLNLRPVDRRQAYACDVAYGTNHEFGFDYLRDNMKFSLEEYVQRELTYAIVDEVDNILIDEARTPLIISGPAEQSTDKYYSINRLIPRLRLGATTVGDVRQEDRAAVDAQGDYTVDEKAKAVTLTESGVGKVERMMAISNLYDPNQIDILHHVNQALRAHALFKRDVDYVVKDGQVVIVDEFTGRLMPGRRWSDGLHQAVEAKEGVKIERENQTLATITLQNYFRMYRKVAGMTGTADTEAAEFKKIYGLDVVVMPSNKVLARTDQPDVVYKSEREKFNAVVDEIVDCHERQQPVLVGTISVEKSEVLGRMLKKKRVKHNVLNAINHEAEANIIAQAGRFGAVTIATNMAGRGTDILLGGNPEFLARSEMENEWVNRSSKSPQGARRYEDVLAQLREDFDEALETARRDFEPRLAPLEEAQNTALDEVTEAHRQHLEATFWSTRGAYEYGAVAIANDASGAEATAVAAELYATAMEDIDHITGPHYGEEGQIRFRKALQDLCTVLRESGDDGPGKAHWQRAQAAFDRARLEYERAIGGVLGANSDLDPVATGAAFADAERRFRETEETYSQERVPYEEAVTEARATYERERRKYTDAITEVREQMEAAPDEIRERYGEILARYEGVCADERARVVEAGGLMIVGTERHESRRIDNQLRGRAGRQGDPGGSRFYLSLEDDLLRIFGADRIQGLMERLGMEEGEPIEHRMITRAIANAQTKVEARDFDVRKHLLEYDDVMNKQREVIYGQRRDVLNGEALKEQALQMAEGMVDVIVESYGTPVSPSEPLDWAAMDDAVFKQFNVRLEWTEEQRDELKGDALADALGEYVRQVYDRREAEFGEPVMRQIEKIFMLQTIDQLWKDHLLSMDHLKEGIGLRGYAQKNPLQEYKKEGFVLFEEMINRIHEETVQKLFSVQVSREEELDRLEARRRQQQQAQLVTSGGLALGAGGVGGTSPQAQRAVTQRRDGDKVGRNDPCPCGSGKKYKKCHGS